MSTLLAVITCRPSFFSFCQARQFSILRRSTQLVGVLTRHKEYKFIHTEHVRVRLRRSERLKQKLEDERDEQMPSGLYNKLKYYLKRYWYIAIPVHSILCVCWFGMFYLAVHL
ncbi:hypothetical protein Mgra_00004853 [Meloidogyne graminicola]|uniref:DUF1279 domain-containing protein n=1 Tax=Meloidogyne graminicola TaxID=189291 RepID=A0A8S9ZQQ8_9BILA|nr:hypothetical protein Mgra_00004853 [Meloidogyne graminicola]